MAGKPDWRLLAGLRNSGSATEWRRRSGLHPSIHLSIHPSKYYSANIKDVTLPIHTPFARPIIGRVIKIHVVSLVGNPMIRLELTGKPLDLEQLAYDSSKMTTTSSPAGGQCALDTSSCANGWHVNTAIAWVEVDLGMLHYITTVYINTTNGASWSKVDFDIKKHPDQFWKTLQEKLINTMNRDGWARIYFTHHIKAWIIKMTFSSFSGDGHIKMALHAEKTPACPVAMFQSGKTCIFPHKTPSEMKYFQEMCEELEWTERSYQFMIKDIHDANHLYDFMVPIDDSESVFAGFMGINDTWLYDDGSATDMKTPWEGTVPLNVQQNHFGFIDKTMDVTADADHRRRGACQTRPALTEEDEKCIPTWYYFHQRTLPVGESFYSYNTVTLAFCLHQCLHVYRNKCTAVTYQLDKYKNHHCFLFKTNSLATSLSNEANSHTYEWHCHDPADRNVFRDLADQVSYNMTASAQLDNTWSKDEAPLKLGSKYGWVSPGGLEDGRHWLQVDFDKDLNLVGMLIVPLRSGSPYYTQSVYIWYWNDYGWQGLPNITTYVDTNWNSYRGKFIRFPWRITTRQIRIVVKKHTGRAVLQFELYGHQANQTVPVRDFPLGMETKDIGGYQIKAKSFSQGAEVYPPSGMRLGSTVIGSLKNSWRPSPTTAKDDWVQVDLLAPHLLTRLRFDKVSDWDGMTEYILKTSMDGITWNTVLTDAHACLNLYNLYGNILTNLTTPVTARYIRIFPTAYRNFVDVKAEIYGVPVCDRLIEGGVLVKLAPSMLASFCWDNKDPTYSYKEEFNCSAWCVDTSEPVTFQIDLEKVYQVSRVFLKIQQNSNVTITMTVQLGVIASTMAEEPHAYWQKNGTNSTFILHRMKKARYINVLLQPEESVKFCLYADVHGCKVHDCPVTYMQHQTFCFRAYTYQLTHSEAQTLCEEDGQAWGKTGQLAKLNHMLKVDTVHGLLDGQFTTAWVGASLQAGSWKWSDGDTMSWAAWSPSANMTDQNRDAGFYDVRQQGMVNGDSASRRPFVCELETNGINPYLSWLYQKQTVIAKTDVRTVNGSDLLDCLYNCQTGEEASCSSLEYKDGTCTYATWSRYSSNRGINNTQGDSSSYWELYNAGSCSMPLAGEIYSPVISASSSLDASHTPNEIAYGAYPATFWQTSASDTQPYIQLEFKDVMTTSRLLIAGNGNREQPKYVKSFFVETTKNNVDWEKQLDGFSKTNTFAGNYDAETPYSVLFITAPLFKKMKIFPLTWENAPAMRLQLYGCHFVNPLTCNNAHRPTVSIPGSPDFKLPCHSGWTVIMRHQDPAFSFQRPWLSYKNGFGDISYDFWIGNVLLAYLTKNRYFDLRIEIWATDGRYYNSEYFEMRVDPELDNFALSVLRQGKGTLGDGGLVTIGLPFSTQDADDDGKGCSQSNGGGGFWFNGTTCTSSTSGMLTGDLSTTTYWPTSHGTKVFAKKVIMKFMPTKHNLDNVAAKKSAIRSPDNSTSHATDLDISPEKDSGSCTLGVPETDPWWRVDLEKPQPVKSVKITTLQECCDHNLQDFDIYIGHTPVSGSFPSNGYKLCYHYTGIAPSGSVVSLNCSSVITGRYLAIQVPGVNKTLTLCEVEVYAAREMVGIYQPCERNWQCVHNFTECRPKKGSTKEIYTCECEVFTRDIDATCYPEADIQPTIQNITFPTDGIVRDVLTSGSVSVKISHNVGATIPEASSGSHFDVTVFLTSKEPDYQNDNFTKLPESALTLIDKPTFLNEMVYMTSMNIMLSVRLNVDTDLCFNLSHLCVSVKKSTELYYETNTTNDIHCVNITSYAVCQPDLDISLTEISMPGLTKVVRGVEEEYPFSLNFALGATAYDITEPVDGHRNYEVSYLYSQSVISNYTEFLSYGAANKTNIEITDAVKPLSKSSQLAMVVDITLGPEDMECEQMNYICFALENSRFASFTDSSKDNNIKCFDIVLRKECFPATWLDITSFNVSGPKIVFVREYNVTTKVTIALKNTDQLHNVLPVASPRENFHFEVSFLNSLSKRRKRAITPDVGPFTVVIFGNTSESEGLDVNQTKTFTGTVKFLIPRDKCNDLHFICAGVSPASGASYTISGAAPISCIDFNPLKNCLGVPVKDPNLSANSSIIPVNSSIRTEVKWSEGTDVVYKLDFGDGHSFNWDWKSAEHIYNYSAASVAITHTYVIYGKYTQRLTISNDVSSKELTMDVLVEPVLDLYVVFKDIWKPQPVPSVVNVEAALASASLYHGPFDMWCDSDFNDPGSVNSTRANVAKTMSLTALVISHTYTFDKPDANLTINCSNHVSEVKFNKRIILQAPITNFSMVPSTKLVKTGSSVTFVSHMTTGSHAIFNINFGDGTTKKIAHLSIYSDQPFDIVHVFRMPGNYTFYTEADNMFYSDNFTLTGPIIVQNEVKNLELTIPAVLMWSPSPVSVTVRSTGSAPFATDPSCHWQMNGSTISHEYQAELLTGSDATKTVSISRDYIGHNTSFYVHCYNMVSSVTLLKYTKFYEKIIDFKVIGASAVITGLPLGLVFAMTHGSDIHFVVKDGNGNSFDLDHPSLFASSSDFKFSLTYPAPGNYTATVIASNALGSETQTHNVVVQNRITDIQYWANDSVLYTPGEVTYHMIVGSSQVALKNIHCNWNYNDRWDEYVYHESLKAGMSFFRTVSFDRSYIGLLNTTINCSNLVSNVENKTKTEIILDAVILSSFETNGSVFVTNRTFFTANVSRFGVAPRSCFHLDLGDGIKQIMFGLPVCASDATKFGIPFQEIAYGTMVIEYDYEYKSVHNFDAVMFAYNHVSNHTLTTIAVVKAWTCFAPNITDLDNFTFNKPLVNMKSKPITITPGLVLHCMITNVYVHLWQVFSITDKSTVVLKQTEKAFHYTVRLLPYGLWQLNYTVSMEHNSGTDKSETVFLQIIKTPLDINIGGSQTETIEFMKPYTLNAVDFSFDHDVEPHDKSGIVFKWNCSQHNSTFQTDSVDLTSLSAEMQDVFEYRETCFGRKTKDLDETSGVFEPDTNLMLPGTWYHIGVYGTKDTRLDSAGKWLYIKELSAPEIEIRCTGNNCAAKKGYTKPVVLEVSCSVSCESSLGGLSYNWSLVINYENGTEEPIYNLKDWTESGTTSKTIIFKEKTLRAGQYHTVTVTAITPGSEISQRKMKFLVNSPPYGGSCDVIPREGVASTTNFVATCDGWKEFKPESGKSSLLFYFETSYNGSDRSFPIGFGSNPKTEQVKFPLGDYKNNFQLNVIATIVDPLGDHYTYVFSVQVIPRQEPVTSTLMHITDQIGSELKSLSQAGNFTEATAMSFALCSELNYPTEYAMEGSNSTVSLEELEKQKTKLRTQIISNLATYVIKKPEEQLQNMETMRSVMEVKEQLELEALETGTHRLEELTINFRNFKSKGEVKNVKMMSKDLGYLAVQSMGAGDHLYHVSSKVSNDSTSGNSTAGNTTQKAESDKQVLKKVQNVMNGVVNVVHNITISIAEDMKPGDGDEEMVFDGVTLLVAMATATELQNETEKNTKQGSVNFKQPKELFGADAPECIESQMFFTKINPFIYGNGSENDVGSSVLDIQMINCDHKLLNSSRRKKRGAPAELKPKIPIDISLVPTNLPDPIKVINASRYERYIYHELNMTEPLKPVQIHIEHALDNTLELFIGINEKPDDKKSYRNFTVNYTQSFLLSPEEILNFINDSMNRTVYNSMNGTVDDSMNGTVDDSINGTVFVAVRSSACRTAPNCNGRDGILTYSLYLYAIDCQRWDKDAEKWNSMSCKIEKDSTPERIRFKSNLLGSLGTGLFRAPNKINFGTVFDNLGAKIVENMPVVATVIGVIILYIIGLVWCRQLDKADAIKWQVLPLIGNVANTEYDYEVHVYTGFKRKAETNSKVYCNIIGAYGSTETRELTDVENRKNFRRGEPSSFLLSSPTDLGKLYSVNVWHDSSGGDWFLSKIIVVDRCRNQWYQFMCNKWLSEDKEDGKTSRMLDVFIIQSNVNAGVLMRNNMSRKFFDDHLWLSVAVRKSRSRFTRAQRLSCCAALLYLTMIGNAMWYQAPDEGGGQTQVLHLGPITISVAMLAASIYSSLVVIPPILLITFLFSKARQKSQEDNDHELNKLHDSFFFGKKMQAKSPPPPVPQGKKKLSLPHWCIILGWILVFLSISASALFTILYSFEWGGQKSTGWLIAFILSFFESVIIVQPAKVLLLSMILSLVFKKDADTYEYEENYGDMQNWFDLYNDEEICKLHDKMARDTKDEGMKLRHLDGKVVSMLKEILSNFFVILVMLCVAYISYDPNMYQHNANLKFMLVESASPQVDHVFNVWPWVEEVLIPTLYYTENYNKEKASDYDKKFISDGLGLRFGPPRLRQLRVSQENCKIRPHIMHITKRCIPWKVSRHGDKRDYLTNWTVANHDAKDYSVPANVRDAYKYRSAAVTKILSYWATFEVLPGGGYVANLGNDKEGALELVKHLKAMRWIDERTRALFAEFNIFNGNTELFTQVILTFEFPPTGGVYTWHTFSTIQLYRYTGVVGLFALIMEIISLIVFVVLVVYCIKDVVTMGKEYVLKFWNWVHIISLVLYAAAAVVYGIKTKWTVQTVEYMMNNREDTISFQHVTLGERIFLTLFGLVIFLLTLRFLNILRFNWTVAVLGKVLAASTKDVLLMGTNIFLVVMAFTALGHSLLGSHISGYMDITHSLTTLSISFLGKFDFKEISDTTGTAGEVFILCYLLVMIFIVINLFITLLCTFLDEVRADTSVVPRDHEVVDHFLAMVHGFVFPDKSDEAANEESVQP